MLGRFDSCGDGFPGGGEEGRGRHSFLWMIVVLDGICKVVVDYQLNGRWGVLSLWFVMLFYKYVKGDLVIRMILKL